MKIALIVAGCIVGAILLIVAVIAVIGSRLPAKHSATRSARLHQPPEKVYAVAHDFAASPTWRADVRQVEVTRTTDGRVRFREEGKHGAVNYELAEDVPNSRMVTQILDTDLGYSGKWTYVFTPEGPHTRLTITEDGEVSNVIFRFLSKYAFSQTATIDGYLISLGKNFGETITPE